MSDFVVSLEDIISKDSIGGNTVQCDSLYRNPIVFKGVVLSIVDVIVDLEKLHGKLIDYVCVIGSKGYLIGSAVAYEYGIPMIMVKKRWSSGKHENFVCEPYETKHSKGQLEMLNMPEYDGKTVMIIDDILETGNTAKATVNMLNRCGFSRIDMASVIQYGSDENLCIENLNSYYGLFQIDTDNPDARTSFTLSLS